MRYESNYSDENSRRYIVSQHKEVFEEIKEATGAFKYARFPGIEREPSHQYKKHSKTFEIDKVLGVGSGNTIVEVCIPLCPPAVEIIDCLATESVVFDALIPKDGKVFVSGRLLKCIPYRTGCRAIPIGCCHNSGTLLGNTKNAVIEVPFIICVNVPGAVKGSKIVVLDYDVNSLNIPNHEYCRCLIKSITEKDCISVKVKAVKPTIIKHRDDCCDEYC